MIEHIRGGRDVLLGAMAFAVAVCLVVESSAAQQLSDTELFEAAQRAYAALPDTLSPADGPEYAQAVMYLFAYQQRGSGRLRTDRAHASAVAEALDWLLKSLPALRAAGGAGDSPGNQLLLARGLAAYRELPRESARVSSAHIEQFVTAQSSLFAVQQLDDSLNDDARDALERLERDTFRLRSSGVSGDDPSDRGVAMPRGSKPSALASDGTATGNILVRARANSRMCFHKQQPGWSNGNNVHLWDCSAGDATMKTWVYDPASGYIRLASNPAKCLHKQRPGWGNGNNVHLWDCAAGANEMKTWVYDRETGYIHAALNPAMCLHKQTPRWENGNNVHLWACDQGNNEMKSWTFTPAGRN